MFTGIGIIVIAIGAFLLNSNQKTKKSKNVYTKKQLEEIERQNTVNPKTGLTYYQERIKRRGVMHYPVRSPYEVNTPPPVWSETSDEYAIQYSIENPYKPYIDNSPWLE